MSGEHPTIVLLGMGIRSQYFRAAVEGALPLKEQIPLQIGLTSYFDPKVASRAVEWLEQLDGNAVADYLRVHGSELDLAFFARHGSDSAVLTAILQHRRAPCAVLEELAPKLSPDLQEVLVLRQDAIVKMPAILAALERNPDLTSFSKRRIWEYREHLLPREDEPVTSEPITPEPPPRGTATKGSAGPRLGMFNWRELNMMACDLRYRPDVRRSAERMLLEQLPHLHAAERTAIARQAGAGILAKLLYDASLEVVRAVLGNPLLQEQSLLRLVASDRAPPPVLELVAGHARWRMRYSVRLALCRNPKTPFASISGFVRTLQPRDLRALVARNATASVKVRLLAGRLRRGSAGKNQA